MTVVHYTTPMNKTFKAFFGYAIDYFGKYNESKLLSRWHYKTGEKLDIVYDKIKLSNEKLFLSEYNAFLNETREKEKTVFEEPGLQVSKTDENPDSSSIQVRKGGSISKVIIHRMSTKPDQIKPGENEVLKLAEGLKRLFI